MRVRDGRWQKTTSLKKGTPPTRPESGTWSRIQHKSITPPHSAGGVFAVTPTGPSSNESRERCQPSSGFFSRSPGQAYEVASGYSTIHNGANLSAQRIHSMSSDWLRAAIATSQSSGSTPLPMLLMLRVGRDDERYRPESRKSFSQCIVEANRCMHPQLPIG